MDSGLLSPAPCSLQLPTMLCVQESPSILVRTKEGAGQWVRLEVSICHH